MKFKKLAIAATAAMMATSVGASVGAESTVQASSFASDLNVVANEIRTRNAIAGIKLAIGAAKAVRAAYKIDKAAHNIDAYNQNHAQFHLKKKKVYLILHNGKRAGKRYVLRKGTRINTQSWVVPKKTYKIHGMKCYYVGKTKKGKRLYLPVKYTAYTHVTSKWK